MKIVIDARIIHTSTGRYVQRLLEYIQPLDRHNDYVVLLRAADAQRWQPSAPNVKVVVADYPPYTFREQILLAIKLYRLRADLVHFTAPHFPLLYRRRHVVTVHDLTLLSFVNRQPAGMLKAWYKYWLKPRVFKLFTQLALKPATHIITPTDYVRNEVMRDFKIPPAQISRTYEAADQLATAPQPVPALQNQPFILYVGASRPYKNLQRLIDAHAKLQGATVQLVLAGKTAVFDDQLKAYVQDKGYTNVTFTGFVSDAELVWLYQHAALYIFPSLSEGFGLPGLEAMLYDLPVASSNATCLPEVYGDAAVYFDPRDTDDMARVISKTLADPKKLAALKVAGRQRVQQFSWKRMAEQTLAIYEQARKK